MMSRLREPYASVLDLIGADAGGRADQVRYRPLPAVHQARKPEPRRLDQGPHRAVDDRRRRARRPAGAGGTIVEATAGNTGLGLAQVGIPKGYRIVLVVPDKMSREKIQHLRALGAEVRMTRSDVGKGHPEYYQDMAEKLAAETPGAFYVNQFANPANPLAHETTTGPEIWEQLGDDVDAVVVGVGSGGTLTGLGRFFAKVSPKTEMVLADPVGSVLAPLIKTGEMERGRQLDGGGHRRGFRAAQCRPVAGQEGLFDPRQAEHAGGARPPVARKASSPARRRARCSSAALRYCREQTRPKRVVTFVCDSGNKYLSKVFDDFWLAEQGLAEREQHGDLRDLVTRSHREGGTRVRRAGRHPAHRLWPHAPRATSRSCRCSTTASWSASSTRATSLPMVEGPYDGRWERFNAPVARAMTSELHTLQASQSLDALLPVFDRNEVAIVFDGDEFVGLITRIDLINHLRRAR